MYVKREKIEGAKKIFEEKKLMGSKSLIVYPVS